MGPKTVGIITYDYPHLKTEQVIQAFLRKGYLLRIYALPFRPRKESAVLIDHRPDQAWGLHPEVIARKHGIEYIRCNRDIEIDSNCEMYHVLAGKIISAECMAGKRIINCYPGILPGLRGPDAFKWTIYQKKPLGVTLHYIAQEISKEEIISVSPTNIYKTDTIESLARRHYENEIEVISNFENYLNHPINNYADIPEGKQNTRMSMEKESETARLFDSYVQEFAQTMI